MVHIKLDIVSLIAAINNHDSINEGHSGIQYLFSIIYAVTFLNN